MERHLGHVSLKHTTYKYLEVLRYRSTVYSDTHKHTQESFLKNLRNDLGTASISPMTSNLLLTS